MVQSVFTLNSSGQYIWYLFLLNDLQSSRRQQVVPAERKCFPWVGEFNVFVSKKLFVTVCTPKNCIIEQVIINKLNSSTIDELSSRCLEGWWSQPAIRQREWGYYGNRSSGHHQRHRHSKPNHWNTYKTRYLPKGGRREEGGGGGGLDNKASKMTRLSRRPGSKQMRCEPWGAPQQRKYNGLPWAVTRGDHWPALSWL